MAVEKSTATGKKAVCDFDIKIPENSTAVKQDCFFSKEKLRELGYNIAVVWFILSLFAFFGIESTLVAGDTITAIFLAVQVVVSFFCVSKLD